MPALIVLAAMIADLATFAVAVPVVGIGAEMNPVMAKAYADFGLVMVVLLKTACAIALVLLVLRTRGRMRIPTALFAASIAILGVAGNVTSLLLGQGRT